MTDQHNKTATDARIEFHRQRLAHRQQLVDKSLSPENRQPPHLAPVHPSKTAPKPTEKPVATKPAAEPAPPPPPPASSKNTKPAKTSVKHKIIKRSGVLKPSTKPKTINSTVAAVALFALMGLGFFGLSGSQPSQMTSLVSLTGSAESTEYNGPRIDWPAEPSEGPAPNVLGATNVASGGPKTIQIPELGVNARIVSTTSVGTGVIDIARSIHDVAWYDQSSGINDPAGTLVLIGFTEGFKDPGALNGIEKLQYGDRLNISRDNKKPLNFTVYENQSYEIDDPKMMVRASLAGQDNLDVSIIACSLNSKVCSLIIASRLDT